MLGRREFLLAAVPLTLALGADVPDIPFPTDPRERLSVSTSSFRSVIKSRRGSVPEAANAKLTLEEFAVTVPARFNVRAIELWSSHFESVDPDYIHRLSASLKKSGVHVVNILVDGAVLPCNPDPEAAKSSLTREKWVDIAAMLGAPSIRVHVTERAREACVTFALRRLATYGSQKNVVINVENDDAEWEEAFRIMNMIIEAHDPFLRALPNFCSARKVGDEAYALRALKVMFLHAYNISHVQDSPNCGVDIRRAFEIAKQAGYRGYFSMECEGNGDPYEQTRRLIELSLQNLS